MRNSISCSLATVATFILAAIATRYLQPFPYFSPFYNGQVQLAALATVLAAASFILHRNLPAVVLVLAGVAMTAHLPVRVHAFGDRMTAEETAGKPHLRLLSFNVLNSNVENGAAIRDEILNSGADVAVTLESQPLESQLDALSVTYPYRLGCGAKTERCDLMIQSRYPFAEEEIGALSELRSERFMRVAVEIEGQKVNVLAAHLTKPYFDDYHPHELWRLWQRLKRIDGPVVLAGDFNAASIAPDMMWFLRSSKMKKDPFEPATWPTEIGPFGIAIDHVYTRAPLRIGSVNRIRDSHGSNHYGLLADLFID